MHLVEVAAVNLRKLVLLPLESSQVSHAYVRSILWFGDLQPPFHMYTLAHQATDCFVHGKGVDVLILGHAQDFHILDYGSQPELGSVLL